MTSSHLKCKFSNYYVYGAGDFDDTGNGGRVTSSNIYVSYLTLGLW